MVRAVWAGLEFKVSSGAVSALPPFRAGSGTAGPSAIDTWKVNSSRTASGRPHATAATRVFAMTPAQLPPSRAKTDAWLAAQRDLPDDPAGQVGRPSPCNESCTINFLT